MSDIRHRTVDGLNAGDTFTVTRTFTEADVDAFADLSRDYNPIHFTRKFVELKGFRSEICHGLLVGGMLTAQVLFWLVSTPLVIKASRTYGYWVTNRRLVTRSGIFGESLSSLPVEGIAEVTLLRGGLCGWTKTPVLMIRDNAANPQKRATRWFGVEEPEQVQHEILQALDRARTRAAL